MDDLLKRLREIYSETTIGHVLAPRNTDPIPNPDGFGEIRSGDQESLKIWLRVRNDIILDSAFWTNGCAATIACGSMTTEMAKDKTLNEALAITADNIAEALVALPPGNFHCAELAAGALRAAIKDCIAMQQQPWKKLYRK